MKLWLGFNAVLLAVLIGLMLSNWRYTRKQRRGMRMSDEWLLRHRNGEPHSDLPPMGEPETRGRQG